MGILLPGQAPWLHGAVPSMRLRLAQLAIAAALTLGPAVAAAQNAIEITIQIQDSAGLFRDISAQELARFFNAATCQCETPVRLKFSRGTGTLPNDDVEVWAGTECEKTSDGMRDVRCERLDTFDASRLATETRLTIVRADQIEWPARADCGADELNRRIFVLADDDGDGVYSDIKGTTGDLSVDTRPPPQPENITSSGGEDSLVVEWDPPKQNADDIASYQVLCASTKTGQPIFPNPVSSPEWRVCVTGTTTPPEADAGPMPREDAGVEDAGPMIDAGLPAADAATGTGTIEGLDAKFICSGAISATDRSVRISLPAALTLDEDENVRLVLVAIDDHRNPSAFEAGEVHPAPVKDFWEVYEDLGGDAEGGFCFVATAAYGSYDHPFVLVLRDFRDHTLARFGAGRAFIRWYYAHSPAWAQVLRDWPAARLAAQILLWPIVVAAGAWEYTAALDKLILLALLAGVLARRRLRGLLARSRRLRLAAAATTAAALLFAGAGAARAQVVYDEDLAASSELVVPESSWVFELKFGPYTPDIDDEPGLTPPGPYERTFGSGASLMMQIEVDRFFFHPYGQLGVAFTIGWMQNTAAAFAQNPDGTVDYDHRSEADETSFHLIPLSVGVVYRFTRLADDTVIPLVPYAKLGASYYIWWITKGDGSVAETPTNGDAAGATIGWQGTLGLALRADRLDPNAAQNLRTELGVEHAGFFFEVTYADLHRANRLRVGDFTWFAGVNFEF